MSWRNPHLLELNRLRAENDMLRRRVEALTRERDWEAGWMTAKCEAMRAVLARWQGR